VYLHFPRDTERIPTVGRLVREPSFFRGIVMKYGRFIFTAVVLLSIVEMEIILAMYTPLRKKMKYCDGFQ